MQILIFQGELWTLQQKLNVLSCHCSNQAIYIDSLTLKKSTVAQKMKFSA